MSASISKNIVKTYYESFNKQDMSTFLNLLDVNVMHDLNQGGREIGKEKFINFMAHMNRCYKETIKELVIMVDDTGTRAAAEFIVEGTYLMTDKGLPEAKGQHYQLPCGAFFEIANEKITRVTTYYNLKDWLHQVEK